MSPIEQLLTDMLQAAGDGRLTRWPLVHALARLKRAVMESLRTPPQPEPPKMPKCSLCREFHMPETFCHNSQEWMDRERCIDRKPR